MTKKRKPAEKLFVEVGSGNVFADIGMKNPHEALIKARIAVVIGQLIRKLHLSQQEVAEKIGIDQPKVSMLLNGRLKDFSIERLFRIVNSLEQDITIVIRPHKKNQRGERMHVEVAA